MHTSNCSLRAAVDTDKNRVLAWANDPETRDASFHCEPISEAAHNVWFAESLAGARSLYIIERDGTPIGLARLDMLEVNEAVVSLTIAPEHRGQGLGAAALTALTHEAAALGVPRLLAKIRKTNTRSRRTFEHAGFALRREELMGEVPVLLYELDSN